MPPRVSVVVPVRNEEGTLSRCLAALACQDFPKEDYEVIVVDGHSTDGTRACANSFGVRLVSDHGVSVAEARNCGIAAARGEVVAFTDGDCVPVETWLSSLWACFERDPLLGGAGGGLRMTGFGNSITRFENATTLWNYRGFITSNVAYRRKVLEEVGGFDVSLDCGEDWDLWWRVCDAGYRVDFVPEACVDHCHLENAMWGRFLRKQFWYAKHDVRCFMKRTGNLARGVQDGRPVVVRGTWRVVSPSVVNALLTMGLAVAVVTPPIAAPVVVATAATAGARAAAAVSAASRAPEGGRDAKLRRAELPKFVAFNALKLVVRGAGTVVGMVSHARKLRRE